jgi:hypothetical protein
VDLRGALACAPTQFPSPSVRCQPRVAGAPDLEGRSPTTSPTSRTLIAPKSLAHAHSGDLAHQHTLSDRQGFDVPSRPMLSGTILEVAAVIAHRLVESLGDYRDERLRVEERERSGELWVARLLLYYLQHYVFYTWLSGLYVLQY